MKTYFETHPQKAKGGQWSRVRRNGAKPSGVIVVHTAESITDFFGPDWGAENVAEYFTNTTRYASYHTLCDWDSTLQLAPWSAETWHDTGTNNHSVGISAAIQCKDWNELGDRGDAIVRRMAVAAAEYAKWLKKWYGIDVPARRITKEESRRRVPGFMAHGTSDPGRRSDPGPDFNWKLLLSEYSRLMEIKVVPTKKPSKPPVATKKKNKEWPFVALLEDEDFGYKTVRALQTLLKGIDLYDYDIDGRFLKYTKMGLQELLKNWGEYSGAIDGKFFEMSKGALQSGLKSRGFYPYKVDKKWYGKTTLGLQKYLNSQRQYFD